MNLKDAFDGFEFTIGTVVELRCLPGERVSVLSRCLEEWPGGYARIYICRGTAGGLLQTADHVYEHELQPYSGSK